MHLLVGRDKSPHLQLPTASRSFLSVWGARFSEWFVCIGHSAESFIPISPPFVPYSTACPPVQICIRTELEFALGMLNAVIEFPCRGNQAYNCMTSLHSFFLDSTGSVNFVLFWSKNQLVCPRTDVLLGTEVPGRSEPLLTL